MEYCDFEEYLVSTIISSYNDYRNLKNLKFIINNGGVFMNIVIELS